MTPAIGTSLGAALASKGLAVAPPRRIPFVATNTAVKKAPPAPEVDRAGTDVSRSAVATAPRARATERREPKGNRVVDAEALKKAFAGVTRLRAHERSPRSFVVDADITVPSGPHAAGPRPAERDVAFQITEEPDWIEGVREGHGPGPLRELRSGRAIAEAELDLHGLRQAEAEAALLKFVRTQQQARRRVVRVIHGKGLHSSGAAVLRGAVVDLVTKGPLRSHVLALSTCAESSGGAGAILLRLTGRG